ncbi:MAG: hypothetical protein K2R98_23800 [Gemmataceae bacterium]|nr:hypothetical protein [Gemmataceae bacterium]
MGILQSPRIALLLLLVVCGCSGKPAAPFDPVGHWKLLHTDGKPFYITVKSDGTGTSTWGEGATGTWKFEGERLVLTWTDGWTDVITKDGDGFKKIAYEPGRKPEGAPTNSGKAERIDSIPAGK